MSPEPAANLPASQQATYVAADTDFSKEQLDIAVASVALKSGAVTERQFATAMSTWTIHGNVPLIDHLRSSGLLDDEQCQKVARMAADQLASRVDAAKLSSSSSGTGQSVLVGTLEELDPSGTVARLLGIRGVAGLGAAGASSGRRSHNRYRFIRKLGQGGLGRVWLAFDENLKRHVAVKEIRSKENPAAAERFRREAEITGRLEHPGIVPIYQLGEDTQSGEVFYAMRFLGKKTLQDSIREYHERRTEGHDHPMLIRQLLTDFVNICQAIGHAHSRKVIHRDLKPENVAIDSFGQVIVIDWGIAKVVDEINSTDLPVGADGGGSGISQSTMQGQVLGTPLFMAPEQAAGRVDELDERTDIYGLGAILFAILTGAAPHERTRELSSSKSGRELLSAIAGRPTPDANEVRPDVDESLSAICQKAMAKRQYARYQTASQLAEDVQRWMAGEPVSAYRERLPQRVQRWIRNHRLWSQIIAAALTVLVVGLTTFAITARSNAVAQRQSQFNSMRSQGKQIEIQLRATGDQLAKDTRFMSIVPSVQGILDARAGAPGSEGVVLWSERLEQNYEGLLRANGDYLSVAFVMREQTQPPANAPASADKLAPPIAREGVRVERQVSDPSSIRRVPAGRLRDFDDPELMRRVSALPPGEVLLKLIRPAEESGSREHARLRCVTPVYDSVRGDFEGLIVLESNLMNHLLLSLDRMDQMGARFDVTGPTGRIWASDDPLTGAVARSGERKIQDQFPELTGFYAATGEPHRENRSAGWSATRIQLDPTDPDAVLCVISRLWTAD